MQLFLKLINTNASSIFACDEASVYIFSLYTNQIRCDFSDFL